MRLRRLLSLAVLLGSAGLTGGSLAAPVPHEATAGRASFEHRVLFVLVRGSVEGVSASVNLDPDDLRATTGTVRVPLERLQTGNALRDDHARGSRGLDTARFPAATFTVSALTGGRLEDGATLSTTVTGTLTVRGTPRPLAVPVRATRRGELIEVNTQFKFNPHDFGVNYPGSSDVVTINVSFVLRPAR